MSAITESMPDPDTLRIVPGDGTDASSGTGASVIDLKAADSDARLEELYRAPQPNWMRMNMIGSLNGRVTGSDGTSDTLSNRADRRILKLIRQMSDAVIVGAQTVRQEKHTSTAPTKLCIVTGSGNLDGHRITPDEAAESVLVCCPAEAGDRARESMPGATIVPLTAPEGRIQLADVLSELRERGLHQLVVEGGNRLISQFLDAGLLDEVCLTQAPVFAPDSAPSLPGSGRGTEFRRELLAVDSVGYVYQRLFARH